MISRPRSEGQKEPGNESEARAGSINANEFSRCIVPRADRDGSRCHEVNSELIKPRDFTAFQSELDVFLACWGKSATSAHSLPTFCSTSTSDDPFRLPPFGEGNTPYTGAARQTALRFALYVSHTTRCVYTYSWCHYCPVKHAIGKRFCRSLAFCPSFLSKMIAVRVASL